MSYLLENAQQRIVARKPVLMAVVGDIPLSIATKRARILPRWAGLLLIISGVTGLLAGLLNIAPLPPVMKAIVAVINAVLFFFGWGGSATPSGQNEE